MNDTQSPLATVLGAAHDFPLGFASLLLATAGADGRPNASYAPYVSDGLMRLFIYISELAAHTANLASTPLASVLFIEDEDKAHHLFARRRLTCECTAQNIPRDTPAWHEIMDRFAARHGGVMAMLRKLEDFHFFELRPHRASYVRGFAQAYELEGELLHQIRHIADKGHRQGHGAGTAETAGSA